MKRRRVLRTGFSLVEVTLALGVASISLIAIFSLLPVGLRTTQNAIEQSASNDILATVIADLRATPPTSPPGNSATSTQFGISIPANPVASPGPAPTTLYFNSNGQVSSSLNATSRYRLTISFPSNGAKSKTATFVDLRMTWPAAASLTNALGSAETFIALDRN